jgi:hypothetical protein
MQGLNLHVADQAKFIQCQCTEEQTRVEEKYLAEIKELKNALHSKEVEAHTACQILGACISELESDVKRIVRKWDVIIERESKTY